MRRTACLTTQTLGIDGTWALTWVRIWASASEAFEYVASRFSLIIPDMSTWGVLLLDMRGFEFLGHVDEQ